MEILDSPAERDFDEIVHLASQITGTPISLITLVDADRQWVKATEGLEIVSSERSAAFCHYTIQSDDLFEVENAASDSRFTRNRFVVGNPKLRYYAGIPLTTSDGHRLGALCVLDTKARKKLSDSQVFALRALARQTVNQIELRVSNRELEMLRKINTRMISMLEAPDEPAGCNGGGMNGNALAEGNSAPASGPDTHTLQNFREYGRLQKEARFSQTELVPVKDALVSVIERIYPDAQAKGNTFALEIDEQDALPMDGFTQRFILRNLIHNANKYAEGSQITIRYFSQSGDASSSSRHYISVTDNGIGIQNAFLKDYEEGRDLYKIKGTRGEWGSGNGLLFVRFLLHKMGGKLHLQSKVGEYTTAIVII